MSRLRGRPVHLSALLLLLALSVLAPARAGTDGARMVVSAPLAPSAVHETWALAGSTAAVHLARLAPGTPARLRVVPARGGLAGRETPSSICRRTRGCRAAVNGDYFTGSAPVGGAVARGRMLRSPSPEHEQVSLDPLRATVRGLGDAGWSGVVRAPDGTQIPLQAVNRGTVAGRTGLWTADAGPATPACSCLEVVLEEVDGRAVGVLGKPVRVRAVRRAAGGTPLPRGTAVLAATGAAAERLAAATDTAAGRPWTVTLETAAPTRENLGAHPVLLRDGRATALDPEDPTLRDPHPRTVVAWGRDGTAWVGVLDGRQPRGPGTTAAELVRFLQDRGATDAVLLDGGGSSTFASAEGPLNRPSDGTERPVANAVVVVWDPPPTAARATPRPAGRTAAQARSAARPAPVAVAPTRTAPPPAAPAPAREPAGPAPVAQPSAPVAPAVPPTTPPPSAPVAAAPAVPAVPVVPVAATAPAAPVVALPPAALPAPVLPAPAVRTAALLAAAASVAWTGSLWCLVARGRVRPALRR